MARLRSVVSFLWLLAGIGDPPSHWSSRTTAVAVSGSRCVGSVTFPLPVSHRHTPGTCHLGAAGAVVLSHRHKLTYEFKYILTRICFLWPGIYNARKKSGLGLSMR
ncbi:hypothetical protein CYLTODRAFT_146410 [Cylindrobasidium torrendii FP15055 ss-10]|uniref:Secreted protein n=1 Tax=Cylindrobasidium torrendii FP15055 ss-10 TaxID=1314674 RepID=A0A0D7AZ11_9AGAR|nr:hypothetical protein CYLTODRAFT_146410 [Cylindrobasidium torrendii FP15055 ss-10]